MATHNVAAGKVGTAEFTLTASTVDTVTFADKIGYVEVVTDGAAAVWYTVNGVTPTVGGADCYYLPAAASSDLRAVGTTRTQTDSVIKLISSGTPKLRVQRSQPL